MIMKILEDAFIAVTIAVAFLFIVLGMMAVPKPAYAEIPTGYTCSLTINILKPCEGTCPTEKRCKKDEAMDRCDCL
jgi:hypothetical protein